MSLSVISMPVYALLWEDWVRIAYKGMWGRLRTLLKALAMKDETRRNGK